MKIGGKLIFSNIFNFLLILIIGAFAIQNLNSILTKLKFIEIADDLNFSFLEMRLSEKNYFLYRDEGALKEIEQKAAVTQGVLNSVSRDVIRATGRQNYDLLERYLGDYLSAVKDISARHSRDLQSEERLRVEGRKLMEFSDRITHLERTKVNGIILYSKQVLFVSFFAILILALTISHFLSKRIVMPIKEIESIAKSISAGDFKIIQKDIPNDETGSVIRAINSMSGELRSREEQIIQSKKLASLGILIAGVAHEINNPLNNISMIAQTYADAYDSLDRGQRIDFMGKIEGETERIKRIVKNLLDFSKPKEPDLAVADMNGIVKDTLKLVQNMLDVSNIETSLELGAGLPPVFVDGHQIQQVFVNLVANSIQAMSSGLSLIHI